MTTQPDTFTDQEVIDAIEVALGFIGPHVRYSSILRYHLDCLKAHQKDDIRRAEFHKELLKP